MGRCILKAGKYGNIEPHTEPGEDRGRGRAGEGRGPKRGQGSLPSWDGPPLLVEMKSRLAELLLLTLIQGEIIAIFSLPNIDKRAVISNSEDKYEEIHDDTPDPMEGQLPNQFFVKVKNRRSIQKRSTGRAVTIPPEVVERMAKIPTSALSCDLPDIQKEILDAHNKYRRLASPSACNMLKLKWNEDAAKTALNWASKCQVGHSPAKDRKIPDLKCGENTYISAYRVDWETVVAAWYSECDDFKYGQGATSDVEIGHCTQVMWATSSALGCAVADCSTGPIKYNYVCHYGPSGNRGGRTNPWKEGKPCGECPTSCENNLCTNPCPYEDNYKDCASYKNDCAPKPSLKDSCPATCMCTKGEIK